MKVEDNEMIKIYGGDAGLGATFINYLGTFLKTIYGIGQGFGGALRRIASKNVCTI